jgi:anti-anti-sigma regulatory factor
MHANGEPFTKVIESAVAGIPLIVVEGDLDQSSKQVVLDAVSETFRGAYPPENLLIDLTDSSSSTAVD